MELCMVRAALLTGPPLLGEQILRRSQRGSRSGGFQMRIRANRCEFQLLAVERGSPFVGVKAFEPRRKGFYGGLQSRSRRVSKLGGAGWRCSADWSRETCTTTEIATGQLDVHGWKVLLRESGEVVGIVDEIIHIGSSGSDEIFSSVMKVVRTSGTPHEDVGSRKSESEDREEVDSVEFLVPLVEDIVREFDAYSKCLFITPPEGLLELARIPELLRNLRSQLLKFCQVQNEGIKGCLNIVRASRFRRYSAEARQVMAWSGEFEEEYLDVFMPTRRQLIAAERHDLVEDIMAAGGFLSVAQALKLPARRRPNGFWEDLRNLDAEIEWFVSGSWTEQEDPVTGETFYYNQATDEVSSHEPSPGSVSNPVPVSGDNFDVCTAVMPRQRKVREAGRYDLHHAIMMHGGYKLVAQELGRQPMTRDTTTKLIANMKSFMEEKSMSTFPSFEELRAHGRNDLAYALRRHGGINTIADIMDIRPKRYGKGQWSCLAVAAAAIRSYMCGKLIEEKGLNESSIDWNILEDRVWNDALRSGALLIPSQDSFLKEGRGDLRYLLQKFGRQQLSDYLGLGTDVSHGGRKQETRKW